MTEYRHEYYLHKYLLNKTNPEDSRLVVALDMHKDTREINEPIGLITRSLNDGTKLRNLSFDNLSHFHLFETFEDLSSYVCKLLQDELIPVIDQPGCVDENCHDTFLCTVMYKASPDAQVEVGDVIIEVGPSDINNEVEYVRILSGLDIYDEDDEFYDDNEVKVKELYVIKDETLFIRKHFMGAEIQSIAIRGMWMRD